MSLFDEEILKQPKKKKKINTSAIIIVIMIILTILCVVAMVGITYLKGTILTVIVDGKEFSDLLDTPPIPTTSPDTLSSARKNRRWVLRLKKHPPPVGVISLYL